MPKKASPSSTQGIFQKTASSRVLTGHLKTATWLNWLLSSSNQIKSTSWYQTVRNETKSSRVSWKEGLRTCWDTMLLTWRNGEKTWWRQKWRNFKKWTRKWNRPSLMWGADRSWKKWECSKTHCGCQLQNWVRDWTKLRSSWRTILTKRFWSIAGKAREQDWVQVFWWTRDWGPLMFWMKFWTISERNLFLSRRSLSCDWIDVV